MRFYTKRFKIEQRRGERKRWFAWFPIEFGEEPSVHWLEFVIREYDPLGSTIYWYYPLSKGELSSKSQS